MRTVMINCKGPKFVFLVMLLFLSGCASTNMVKCGKDGYAIEDDERRMFERSREMSEALDTSRLLYGNNALELYLNGVLSRIVPSEANGKAVVFSVKVLNDPSLNAFALPNGRIYVHTGMLAAMENEAQVATLLGHEAAHIINRDSLKQSRSIKNKTAFFSTLQAPTAAFVGDLGVLLEGLIIVSSMYGYSREVELIADNDGFVMLEAAGYDVQQAPRLFEHLKEFIDNEEIKQPFFFSTHPNVKARIESYQSLAQKKALKAGPRITGNEAFSRFSKELSVDTIQLSLKEGMFKTAQQRIDVFTEKFPGDSAGYYWRAELYRQRQDHAKGKKFRDKSGDYPLALQALDKALSLEPSLCDAWGAKGKLLQKLGRKEEAVIAYRKYLELAPDASDKDYINKYIEAQQ